MQARRGSRSVPDRRANTLYRKMLAEYEPPAIDPAIDEAVLDFIRIRKESMPDAFT